MPRTVLDPAAAPNTPARRSTSPQATTQRPWPGNAQVPPARGGTSLHAIQLSDTSSAVDSGSRCS